MKVRFELRSRMNEALRWCRNFMRDEPGVVPAEWVAIAGAVFIGAIFVLWFLTNSMNTPASSISGNLSDCETWASSNSTSTSGCN